MGEDVPGVLEGPDAGPDAAPAEVAPVGIAHRSPTGPVAAGAVAFGVVVRLVILVSPLGRADADELVSGIMAQRVLETGVWPTFVAGQQYGGTPELVPVVVLSRLFGWSLWALRIPTLLWAGANAVLLWRIGRRVVDEGTARLAGLLLWVGPPLFVWFGLREQLFYAPTVGLGLGAVLLALRVRDGRAALDGAAMGLCLGLGWWVSPNIVYSVVPVACALLWGVRSRAGWRRVGVAAAASLPALLVGAWPWIAANRASGWYSLSAEATRDFPITGTYAERIGYFVTEGLPGASGMRTLFTHDWVAGALGAVVFVAVLGLVVLGMARAVRATPWDAAGLLAYPFVFARIPFVMDQPNFRYVFFAVPFVVSLLARAVTGRRAVLALGVAALVTVVGLVQVDAVSERDGTRYRVGGVGDVRPVVDALDAQGVAAVYGDYWVAYPILFESGGRIAATPSWGIDRDQPARSAVQADPDPAWVVVADSGQERALLAALSAAGVSARTERAGEFTIVRTDRAVRPWDLPDAARHLEPGSAPPRR